MAYSISVDVSLYLNLFYEEGFVDCYKKTENEHFTFVVPVNSLILMIILSL